MVKNTFKFSISKRWFPLIIAPLFISIAYGFVYEAVSTESIVGSALCVISACMLLVFPVGLARYSRNIIITNDQGLLIKSIFKTTFLSWDEITEYGRIQKRVFLSTAWLYYVKKQDSEKKIIIGLPEFKNFRVLNNIIVRKAIRAKFRHASYIERDNG